MKKILILIFLFIILCNFSIINPRIVRIYDGDTIYIDIPNYPKVFGTNIGVRIKGIDAPEIRTTNTKEKSLGYKARDSLSNFMTINNPKIIITNIERDKYFRLLADIYVNGTNVKDYLLNNKLVLPYDGGKKTNDWNEWEE